jgi:hypothetical protein
MAAVTTGKSPSAYPRMFDDVNVRLVAGEVLVLSIVFAATQQLWLYAFLAVDFAIRAVIGPKASPLALLVSKVIRPRLSAAPRPTPAPPKRFAATMGVIFSALIVAFWAIGVGWLAWVVVAIMIVFPALESIAGICVGCQVFALGMRMGIVPESVCLECADIRLRQQRLSQTP